MTRTELHEQFDAALDTMLAYRPTWATDLGLHHADDRLDDLSDTGVRDEVAALQRLSGELAVVPHPADVDDEVDLQLLRDGIAGRLFALAVLDERSWNPLVHLPGGPLHALLSRPYAPTDVRVAAVTARIAAIPDAISTARAVLRDLSAVHRDTAIDQLGGVLALVRDAFELLEFTAGPVAQQAVSAATTSLEQFRDWLREQPAARDPRLGAQRWSDKLAFALATDTDPYALREQAHQDLARTSAALREEAAEFLGARPGTDCVAAAFGRLSENPPDDRTIVGLAAGELERATAFVRDHLALEIPPDPVEVVAMPEFARGVAVAYCDSPGPLESAVLPTFYAIAPTPASWDSARRDSFYREYNRNQLGTLTVHEAMPGHALQLAHARRHALAAPHRVRAAFRSGSFVEGWAVHAEATMADLGYGGLPVRLQQRKMALRMTINAILDHGVHAGGMTEPEAMALMTGAGHQEQSEAAGKWKRALLSSTQLSTYYVGWREVSQLATEHLAHGGSYDQFLAHGSPPPRALRALLGLGPTG